MRPPQGRPERQAVSSLTPNSSTRRHARLDRLVGGENHFRFDAATRDRSLGSARRAQPRAGRRLGTGDEPHVAITVARRDTLRSCRARRGQLQPESVGDAASRSSGDTMASMGHLLLECGRPWPSGGRAGCSAVDPRLDQLAELGLGARCGFASGARIPSPAHEQSPEPYARRAAPSTCRRCVSGP